MRIALALIIITISTSFAFVFYISDKGPGAQEDAQKRNSTLPSQVQTTLENTGLEIPQATNEDLTKLNSRSQSSVELSTEVSNKETSNNLPPETKKSLISTLSQHNIKSDCWLRIENNIYDVTDYIKQHPGGSNIISPFCGKDATKAFATKSGIGNGEHSDYAHQLLLNYYIGSAELDPIVSLREPGNIATPKVLSTTTIIPVAPTRTANPKSPTPLETLVPIQTRSPETSPIQSGITLFELARHNSKVDCWLLIDGNVYDITSYIPFHPGGDIILTYCGKDGSQAFKTKDGSGEDHSQFAYSLLSDYFVGSFAQSLTSTPITTKKPVTPTPIVSINPSPTPILTLRPTLTSTPSLTPSLTPVPSPISTATPTPLQTPIVLTSIEVAQHSSEFDCWLIINGKVYDVTKYIQFHPGGRNMIIPECGKDATIAFQTQGGEGNDHKPSTYKLLESYYIGDLNSSTTLPTLTPISTVTPTTTPTPSSGTPVPTTTSASTIYCNMYNSIISSYEGGKVIEIANDGSTYGAEVFHKGFVYKIDLDINGTIIESEQDSPGESFNTGVNICDIESSTTKIFPGKSILEIAWKGDEWESVVWDSSELALTFTPNGTFIKAEY